MKSTATHNHDEGSISKALGISKTEEELNKTLMKILEDIMKNGKGTVSEHLAKIVEAADTPEEIAYLAYKFGFGAAKFEDFTSKARKMFGND